MGEFTGILPDAEGFCAKSFADCNNPEIMFYTVFNCSNSYEVYEEREYRCYGQWIEEETGLVYTYTERRDLPGKECFVGSMLEGDQYIITEAGQNCERGHQPKTYGMTLKQVRQCDFPPEKVHTNQITISLHPVKKSLPQRFFLVPEVTQTALINFKLDVFHESEQNDHKKEFGKYQTIPTNGREQQSSSNILVIVIGISLVFLP